MKLYVTECDMPQRAWADQSVMIHAQDTEVRTCCEQTARAMACAGAHKQWSMHCI